ncbi:Hypothetical_protein [Hexamita inflata]|uniref:Hypothetical_protein n=1 Tax=Hexamita inflata TaxID=28002 RepID=A0AA86NV66_9EUKA|nr:Hypothetical protein HINF_LOCUS13387 [Hexamita inflata]
MQICGYRSGCTYDFIFTLRIYFQLFLHQIQNICAQSFHLHILLEFCVCSIIQCTKRTIQEIQRVNEHEQEETDQRVMTLFPALNLEELRVVADTLVPRFIPAIPKIVTKITSEVNNVSSSAELTQVV